MARKSSTSTRRAQQLAAEATTNPPSNEAAASPVDTSAEEDNETSTPTHATEPPDVPDPEAPAICVGKGKGKAIEEEEEEEDAEAEDEGESGAAKGSTTMRDRMAKLKELRLKMQQSAADNRAALHTEHNTAKNAVRAAQKAEKAAKLAEVLVEKREALEEGADMERKKAWDYSIEDSEKWDKKLEKKKRRAQFEFTDYEDTARRKYKRDLDSFKPDLVAYNRQKEIALGLAPGTLTGQVATITTDKAKANAIDLYRDANSLVYADNKPTDDDIDRVVAKINLDIDKKAKSSRVRREDEGDVTYINAKNKHFNKKIARYYNQYTKEIKDSFERGTAL